jgi:putative membrane protein
VEPSKSPSEPDSRLVQANERTLLAWIRTSLALVTFGFVIARLGAWLNAIQPERRATSPSHWAATLGTCFVLLSLVVDVLALIRYRRVVAALRGGQPVPLDRFPVVFGWLVVALGVLVVVYTFLGVF